MNINSKAKYFFLFFLASNVSIGNVSEKITPQVKAWVDKPNSTYYVGEFIKIYINSNSDSYIDVFSLGSSGVTKQIFPSKESKNNFIKANNTLIIPNDNSFYKIVAMEKEGIDSIKIIAKNEHGDILSTYEKIIHIKKYIKKAIFIANDSYHGKAKLSGPPKDVELIKKALQDKNFNEIEVLKNASKSEINNEITNLVSSLNNGLINEGFIYYSGHGTNINGDDYIIPIYGETKEQNNIKNFINLSFLLKNVRNLNFIHGTQKGDIANDDINGSPLAHSISEAIKENDKLSSLDLYNISTLTLKEKTHNKQISTFYKNTSKSYIIEKEVNINNNSSLLVIFDACRKNNQK